MNLKHSFARFAKLELSRWQPGQTDYVPTGLKGALQVYDRFVSDRDFGQKKRIFLVPGEFNQPYDNSVFKIAGVPSQFILEGMNFDADESGVYGSEVVFREARFQFKLYKRQGVARASGVGVTSSTLVEQITTWGDFSRYSASESAEFDNSDYTIGTLYLAHGTPVDRDTILEDQNGQQYAVREISSFLELRLLRVQAIEKEGL